MEDKLKNIISSVLSSHTEAVSIQDYDRDLSEYGMDSFDFIIMVVRLEEEFGFTLPTEYLLFSRMRTINEICEIIRKCQAAAKA